MPNEILYKEAGRPENENPSNDCREGRNRRDSCFVIEFDRLRLNTLVFRLRLDIGANDVVLDLEDFILCNA